MKAALIAMVTVLIVAGVLTGGFGVPVKISLGIVAAIFFVVAIMAAMNNGK